MEQEFIEILENKNTIRITKIENNNFPYLLLDKKLKCNFLKETNFYLDIYEFQDFQIGESNYFKYNSNIELYYQNNELFVLFSNINSLIDIYKIITNTFKIYRKDIVKFYDEYIIGNEIQNYGINKYINKPKESKVLYLIISDHVYLSSKNFFYLISEDSLKYKKYYDSIFICNYFNKTCEIFDCIRFNSIDISNLTHDERIKNIPKVSGSFSIYKSEIFEDNLYNIDFENYYHFKNNLLNNFQNYNDIKLYQFVKKNIGNCNIISNFLIEQNDFEIYVFICYPLNSDTYKKIFIIDTIENLKGENIGNLEYMKTFNTSLEDYGMELYEKIFINPKYFENDIIIDNKIKCIDIYDAILKATCSIYQENNNSLFRTEMRRKIKTIEKYLPMNIIIDNKLYHKSIDNKKTIFIEENFLIIEKTKIGIKTYF